MPSTPFPSARVPSKPAPAAAPAAPPPAPAKPPEKAPEPAKPTPDQLAGVNAFMQKHFAGKDAPVAPAPEPAKKADTPTPPAKPKPAKPAPPPPPPTAAEIAAATAESVTKALRQPVPEKVDPKPELPPLEEDDVRRVQVLKRMEVMYPDKKEYADVAKKYEQSKRELLAYAAKWTADHPGQEFDEDAPEHADFFAARVVDWDDEDFTEARIDLRSEARVEEKLKPTQEKLAELEREKRLMEASTNIKKAQDEVAHEFWKELGGEFEGLVDETGNVNPEKAAELNRTQPEKVSVFRQAAELLEIEAAEIHKLFNDLTPFDPKNNQIHSEINTFCLKKEAEMMALPLQERTNAEGKVFAPASKFARMTKAERAQHWTFSEQDVRRGRMKAVAKDAAAHAGKISEAFNTWAKLRGYVTDQAPAAPQPGEGMPAALAAPALPAEVEAEPFPATGKPQSPSDASLSKMAASRGTAGEIADSPVSSFAKRFLGSK